MINGRTKGHNGERDIVNILKRYDIVAKRNLNQTREGGCDLIIESNLLSEYAVEIKRTNAWSQAKRVSWWEQAQRQALSLNKKPLLVWRLDRGPWFVEYIQKNKTYIEYFITWLEEYIQKRGNK